MRTRDHMKYINNKMQKDTSSWIKHKEVLNYSYFKPGRLRVIITVTNVVLKFLGLPELIPNLKRTSFYRTPLVAASEITLHVAPSNCPKLCGNCAFPQNFHTRKLGELTALYAVNVN